MYVPSRIFAAKLFPSTQQKQTPVAKRKDNINVTVVDYGPKNCNRVKYEHDEAFPKYEHIFLIRHKLKPSGNASLLTPQMGLIKVMFSFKE